MNKEGIKILLVEDDEDDAFFIKDLIAERELDPRRLLNTRLIPNPLWIFSITLILMFAFLISV